MTTMQVCSRTTSNWNDRFIRDTALPLVPEDGSSASGPSPPRRLVSPALGETFFAGILGSAVAWSNTHPRLEDLEALRMTSDDIADAALDALLTVQSSETAVSMHDLATALRDANTALDAGDTTNPYTHLVPMHQAALRAMWAQVTTVPDWVDWDQIADGQSFFWQNTVAISWVLSMGTLLGGYSAASIAAVLDATGYLSGRGDGDRIVMRRVLETGHMLLLAMQSIEGLRPGGDGWTCVVNVRFLHALVRRRVLAKAKSGAYSVAQHGVPINQEDLVVTALGFSMVTLAGLERLGVVTGVLDPCAAIGNHLERGVGGYMHAWAYLSYLSGVRDDVNPLLPTPAAHKAVTHAKAAHLVGAGVMAPTSPDTTRFAHAMRVTQATVLHLYAPNATSRKMAAALINGLSEQPPMHMPRAMNVAVARTILCDRFADDLGVPATTTRDMARVQWMLRYVFRPVGAVWQYAPWMRPLLKERMVAVHHTAFDEIVVRPAMKRGKTCPFAFHTGSAQEDSGPAVCPMAHRPVMQMGREVMKSNRVGVRLQFVAVFVALIGVMIVAKAASNALSFGRW
ncbi:hypothetical protein GGF31_005275 [Allomyces arbusculus]|nr:hypothetical protein GGF31_005275 [Allomyces arbusculus]